MSILTPRHVQFDSYIERAKFLMVYRLTLLFTTLFIVLSVIFYNVEFIALIAYLTALFISAVSLIYLLVSQRYRHMFLLFAIAGTLVSHFSCNFSESTPHYVDFLWMMISSLLAFVGVGRKWGLIILAINAVAIGYFIFFSHNPHVDVIQPLGDMGKIGVYIELLVALFVIAYLMHQFIAFQNHSETRLRKANLELADQNSVILSKNRENSTLLKEIHHRVKNNLQIIISLLRLQQSDIKNPETHEHFSEAINRVMVMASIHQRLYQEKEISKIDLAGYIHDLASDLKRVFHDNHNVTVNISCQHSEIDLKTVVPLGLLLNELISNSFKYAFEQSKVGTITVNIQEKKGQLLLNYSDTGKWKAMDESTKGFGLELIRILTDQFNGTYDFRTSADGTHYDFTLSKLN